MMNTVIRVSSSVQLLAHEKYPVYIREFGDGALLSAKDKGITVIIDNFRASNTILALFEYTDYIKPVLDLEDVEKSVGFVKVGEDSRDISKFDFDNSPTIIVNNPEAFKNKQVVVRTTNGTRGLINAIGSKEIILGSFRNITRVVDYCYQAIINGDKVSFVPMGSKTISRIEDTHGARMMYYLLLRELGEQELFESDENPWQRDWLSEIKKLRPFEGSDKEDRIYCVDIDATDKLPRYNPDTGFLELI